VQEARQVTLHTIASRRGNRRNTSLSLRVGTLIETLRGNRKQAFAYTQQAKSRTLSDILEGRRTGASTLIHTDAVELSNIADVLRPDEALIEYLDTSFM